jgi:hypothetical protein
VTQLLRGGYGTFDPRLDRVPSFDPLSFGYPVRGLLAAEIGTAKPPLRSFTWQVGPVLDQGREGACVGFGHGARVMSLPDRHKEVDNAWAREVYKAAQKIDEWPGESYEGTSVLAGAKVLKGRGFYEAYHWAFGIDDTLRAIGYLGPVVLGINWLEGMDDPRPSGLVEVSGQVRGGHCILARGVRLRAVLPGEGIKPLEVVRLRNSWGPDYAAGGDIYLKVEGLERLLQAEGEACVPVEPRQHRKDFDTAADTATSWP